MGGFVTPVDATAKNGKTDLWTNRVITTEIKLEGR